MRYNIPFFDLNTQNVLSKENLTYESSIILLKNFIFIEFISFLLLA